METSTKIAVIGGAAGLAWWYFSSQSPAGPVAIPAGNAGAVPAGGSTALSSQSALMSLLATGNALASRIAGAAASDSAITVSGSKYTATPDVFNWYLANLSNTPVPNPPDPDAVFGNHNALDLASYWAMMSAYLAANRGLSGVAGFFRGMSGLAGRAR